MSAIEIMTIVGSKGLSADHVIVIGFDNINMKWVTKNAFYVAMTRARQSLHLVTALGSGGATMPHIYLGSLPEEHIELYKYTKKAPKLGAFQNKTAFAQYLQTLVRMRSSQRR